MTPTRWMFVVVYIAAAVVIYCDVFIWRPF